MTASNVNKKSPVAIVTGGANGIGEAIAQRLARDGCRISLWDVDAVALDRACTALRAAGADVRGQVIDISNRQAVRGAMDKVVAELGVPDVLVNSAAIHRVGSIVDGTPEDFELMMKVNVQGTFNCCHAMVPLMVGRQRGSIINIASWLGKAARPSVLAYCTSKFAMIGMTQSMALDLAKTGVRVNAVCPGTIADTGMRRQSDEECIAKGLPTGADRANQIPMGRLGTPAEIANVVAFLASDEASYMTGQSLNVTGGLWMN